MNDDYDYEWVLTLDWLSCQYMDPWRTNHNETVLRTLAPRSTKSWSEGEICCNFYWGIDAIFSLRALWPRDWPTCFNHGCVYSPLYCTLRFTAFYQSPLDAIFWHIISCKSAVCASHDDLALFAPDRRIFMNPNWNLLECLAVCLLNRKPSHQLAFLSDLASVSLQQSHWSQHLFNKTNAITSSGVRLENKTNSTIAKNKVWIF